MPRMFSLVYDNVSVPERLLFQEYVKSIYWVVVGTTEWQSLNICSTTEYPFWKASLCEICSQHTAVSVLRDFMK
jgi:hypothetical protein